MASISKRKSVASQDVPRPRPPPKPGAHHSPSIASRAVQVLAATAATSHNMNVVPRHLVTARSDFPQAVDARNGAQLAEIQRLRDAAWEAIGTATVDGSEQHCYWKAWQTHCGLYQDATGKIQAPQILTD